MQRQNDKTLDMTEEATFHSHICAPGPDISPAPPGKKYSNQVCTVWKSFFKLRLKVATEYFEYDHLNLPSAIRLLR